MSLLSRLSLLTILCVAASAASNATIPASNNNGTSSTNSTSNTNGTDPHPAKPAAPTAVLDCGPEKTDGPTLPGGDIDGAAKDFCKSIDGKELTQNTFNFNKTSTWEGPGQSIQGLLLAINVIEDCPAGGPMTLLGSGCTQAFSSIVSGCAPTATSAQKHGGAFTAAACVEYKVELEEGNVWDPATGPVPKKTDAPQSTGTAPPLNPPSRH